MRSTDHIWAWGLGAVCASTLLERAAQRPFLTRTATILNSPSHAVPAQQSVNQTTFQFVHFQKSSGVSIFARHFPEDAFRRKYQWGVKKANGTWLLLQDKKESGAAAAADQDMESRQATIDKLGLVKVPGPHKFVFLSNKKRFFRVDPACHEVDPETIYR